MKYVYQKRTILKIIVVLVLGSFTGCVTTKVAYVENDNLPKDKVYRIAEVFMKDGTVINLRDTEPKFKVKYKGMENIITYYDKDYNIKYIELKNVQQVKIELVEGNLGMTLLVIGGALVILVLLFFYGLTHSGKFNIAG